VATAEAETRREAETEIGRRLSARERRAARRLIGRVRGEVDAELVHASLFGSRARGQARPDSDIDVLLVFRRLPPDREPQATHAEQIAEQVAEETGVPVTVWSVSLVDVERGNRTPMLVDALDDSIPLWWSEAPLAPVPFTPPDALRCVAALHLRIEEGGEEFAELLEEGDLPAALLRGRDDIVRMCIALLLLRGVTRPRRGEAVRAVIRAERRTVWFPPGVRRVLDWAAASFGSAGRDEEAPVGMPPGGVAALGRAVETLHALVLRREARLRERLRGEP
jgi:predicted nucleotidyltransferase